jgi:RNA polymerase sigma-70 factor (ECF subfamily)
MAWRRKVIPLEDCSRLADVSYEDDSDCSVLEAVMALPPKQRICVHLFYYEDLSVKEISVNTGMPESTVKSHLFRARAALEETLKGDYHA